LLRVPITRQEAYATGRKLHDVARLSRHTALPSHPGGGICEHHNCSYVISEQTVEAVNTSQPSAESIPWEWASQTLRPVQSISLCIITFGAKCVVRLARLLSFRVGWLGVWWRLGFKTSSTFPCAEPSFVPSSWTDSLISTLSLITVEQATNPKSTSYDT